MRSFARFVRLPPGDRRLVLAAAGSVAAVRVALWVLPFRSVLGVIRSVGASRRAGAVTPERVVWAVEAAARGVPRATCLVRALAAQALLARRGHPSQLRLGVARGASQAFEAHAWLEQDGQVLIGGGSEGRYVPMPTFDPRA